MADIKLEKDENRTRAVDLPSSDSDDEDEQAYLQSLRDRNKDVAAQETNLKNVGITPKTENADFVEMQ